MAQLQKYEGAWEDLLIEFLLVEHNPDGTHKPGVGGESIVTPDGDTIIHAGVPLSTILGGAGRVLTDSATITWDYATPGEVKGNQV